MSAQPGDHAPPLRLQSTRGDVRVPDPAGHTILLMFFQEAGTPTCTTQVRSLAAERELLDATGALAVCISTDPPERLAAFTETLGGAPALASDSDGAAARAYGVYDESTGRANRAAFVIGPDGIIRLAVPWYNPANSAQLAAIFGALGLGAE